MKKLLFIILCYLSFINISFANVNPASVSSQWGITFDKNSELAKNVVVLKEKLIFKLSYKNIVNKNPKYLWYDYIYKINNNKLLKKYIENDTYNLSWTIDMEYGGDYMSPKTDNPWKIMFYNIPENKFDYDTWSINVTVEYTLKNESNKNINNQHVIFSSLKNNEMNSYYINGLRQKSISDNDILKKLYHFYSENNYPKNLKVVFWWKEINIKDNYMLEDISNNYYYSTWENKFKFKSILIKKVNSFHLSFGPLESKTLKITYNIPLKTLRSTKFMNYDFSPIFKWKNPKLPELEIIVIWNNDNILYSRESSFGLNYTNPMNDIYVAKIKNIEKSPDNNILTISFRNPDDITDYYLCELWGINTDFFCWENWIQFEQDWTLAFPPIEKIDNKNIKITYPDWISKNYKMFDTLK